MADAYGLMWPGDKKIFSACTPDIAYTEAIEGYRVQRVPLMIETVKARHADELYQVLKDLTGLAKLDCCLVSAIEAAIRNADELLNQIESEQLSEASNE